MTAPPKIEETPPPPMCHPGEFHLILRRPVDNLREWVRVAIVYRHGDKAWTVANGRYSLLDSRNGDVELPLSIRPSQPTRNRLGMDLEDRLSFFKIVSVGLAMAALMLTTGFPASGLFMVGLTVLYSAIYVGLCWLHARACAAAERRAGEDK